MLCCVALLYRNKRVGGAKVPQSALERGCYRYCTTIPLHFTAPLFTSLLFTSLHLPRVHLLNASTGQWFEVQDLHVTETQPQLIGLSESNLLVYERKTTTGTTNGNGTNAL